MDEILSLLYDEPVTPAEVATFIKVSHQMEQAGVKIRDLCTATDEVEVEWGHGNVEWFSLDDACQRVVAAIEFAEDAVFE